MTSSTISVVICARNAERYLAETLDSVAAQVRPPDELIVVDDGSTDSTAVIADAHRVVSRVVTTPGLGHAAARNLGIASSVGDMLAFLDADDLWTPNCLDILEAALIDRPDASIAFGHVEQFASPDLDDEQRARFVVPSGVHPGYTSSSMLVRRSCLDAVGPFDESVQVGDFIAWLMAARADGQAEVMVPTLVLRRRHHAGNLGRTQRHLRADYVKVMHESIRRHRAARIDK